MIDDRILNTLKYFSLLNTAVTSFELYTYLLKEFSQEPAEDSRQGETEQVTPKLVPTPPLEFTELLARLHILKSLDRVQECYGFYTLTGLEYVNLPRERFAGTHYAFINMRKALRYARSLRHLPFVRAVAVTGSLALGRVRGTSDIDLFIFTAQSKMFTARTCATAFLQMCGVRRYRDFIAGRFCLNHYMAEPHAVEEFRNVYTATEYAKMVPLFGLREIRKFWKVNQPWISDYIPEFSADGIYIKEKRSGFQKHLESLLQSGFGKRLEAMLEKWQLMRIHSDEHMVVSTSELSLHPGSKQSWLLQKFFEPRREAKSIAKTDLEVINK